VVPENSIGLKPDHFVGISTSRANLQTEIRALRPRSLCFSYLLRNPQRFIDRNRTSLDALGQHFSIDEFHHEERALARFFESEYGGNVGMIQGRQHAGFALESGDTFGIVC
jgi:hypothetical protein